MLKVAVEHKLTGLAGVPTMWNAMLYTESPTLRRISRICDWPPPAVPPCHWRSPAPSSSASAVKSSKATG